MQIVLKITSKIWFGPCGPVVRTRLQSVWFTWRGSRRELGVSDILPKQGLAPGEKLHRALTPLPASPNFNHERLSASVLFRGFLDSSIFTVRGFWGEWEEVVLNFLKVICLNWGRQGNDRARFQVQDVGWLV